MNRRLLAALFVGVFAAGTLSAGAQPRPPAASPATPNDGRAQIDERSARDTQQRLQELLRDYPPSLGRVLQLDPTLLTNQEYLRALPALAAFISQHPDVVHHAAFYLGQPDYGGREDVRSQTVRIFGDVVAMRSFSSVSSRFSRRSGGSVALSSIIVAGSARRRRKPTCTPSCSIASRQTKSCSVIPDAVGAAFSPVGAASAGPRAIGAPIGRILWSVQAGIILAVVGIGLLFAKRNAIEELSGPLNILAILIVALGVGFSMSAAVSVRDVAAARPAGAAETMTVRNGTPGGRRLPARRAGGRASRRSSPPAARGSRARAARAAGELVITAPIVSRRKLVPCVSGATPKTRPASDRGRRRSPACRDPRRREPAHPSPAPARTRARGPCSASSGRCRGRRS